MSNKFNSGAIREFLTPVAKPAFMESCETPAQQMELVSPDEMCKKMVGSLRGAHMWYHAAHVLAKGTGFLGDHVHLYGEIYNNITEQLDGAMEKVVGLTNKESLVCPVSVAAYAVKFLEMYDSPVDRPAYHIAQTALTIEEDVLSAIEAIYNVLKHHGIMTLGLEDFIADLANTHERYYYLLQQRVKTNLD